MIGDLIGFLCVVYLIFYLAWRVSALEKRVRKLEGRST